MSGLTKLFLLCRLANKKNDGGSYFPIWGTCLGMQEMSTWPLWPIRFNPLSNCTGMHGVNLALNFTHQATKSRLFRSLPDYIKKVLRTENVTPNFHNYCLTVKTYERFSELRRFYRVSTINDDVNGLQFVSTMEAYRYPYYGIQYHPEKINFMFAKYADSINRSADAILISQSFANFFIAEARKSQQSFKSFEEEGRFLFDNFKLNYSPTSQTPKYCFNDSDVPRFDPWPLSPQYAFFLLLNGIYRHLYIIYKSTSIVEHPNSWQTYGIVLLTLSFPCKKVVL